MPRRKGETVSGLYGGVPSMTPNELLQGSLARMQRINASLRGDYGGTPANLLHYPSTYQQRVQRVWDGYNTDSFFKRMIDRTSEFASNGFRWELAMESDGTSWLEKLKKWAGIATKTDHDEDFWHAWSAQLNRGVPGIIPGLEEVTRWAARHLMLSGMFVPHWEIGKMKFGKREFLVPTKITCYPGSAITLIRPNASFVEERAYYKLPAGQKVIPIMEGAPNEAVPTTTGGSPDMQELPPMTDNAVAGTTEGFTLKYNWSPGDLVTLRQSRGVSTGAAVYPSVPFFPLVPQFLIRQKLFASDLSVLDGLINYIMLYKIGDKDHPPVPPTLDPKTGGVTQEGTIAMVRRLITEGRVGPAIELFLPYYVNVEILKMDPATLLSEEKYVQSTLEIFQAFGIFFARTASSGREKMEKINISNFEEMMSTLRSYIGAFMNILAMHIVELNREHLKAVPRWAPNPLNSKNEKFIDQLMGLAKIGHVSKETLLRYHGLDDKVEVSRIAGELARDVDDLMDQNVPTSFVQQVVQPDDGGQSPKTPRPPKTGRPATRKTTSISPGKQPGRPKA